MSIFDHRVKGRLRVFTASVVGGIYFAKRADESTSIELWELTSAIPTESASVSLHHVPNLYLELLDGG